MSFAWLTAPSTAVASEFQLSLVFRAEIKTFIISFRCALAHSMMRVFLRWDNIEVSVRNEIFGALHFAKQQKILAYQYNFY